MTTLTIKNIPEQLYKELKNQALINHRSLNSEVIVSLERAVHKHTISPQEIISQARAVRIQSNAMLTLSNQLINKTKREGRL